MCLRGDNESVNSRWRPFHIVALQHDLATKREIHRTNTTPAHTVAKFTISGNRCRYSKAKISPGEYAFHIWQCQITMGQQITGSRLHQIVPDLGSRLGIEGLTADEKGCLTFAVGETVVQVEEVLEGVVLTGFVDSLPDEPSERLLAACLKSNLNAVKSGLPVISLEETTRSLILQLWSRAVSADEVMAAVGRFASQIERVRDSVGPSSAEAKWHTNTSVIN